MIRALHVDHAGLIQYESASGKKHSARLDLFIIYQARERGCDFGGLMWEAIETSDQRDIDRMLLKAMNYLRFVP